MVDLKGWEHRTRVLSEGQVEAEMTRPPMKQLSEYVYHNRYLRSSSTAPQDPAVKKRVDLEAGLSLLSGESVLDAKGR